MTTSQRSGTTPGFLQLALSDGVPKRSFLIALVVGSILTAINQGDLVLAGMMPNLIKVLLNYLVPFCVSTYGAVTAKQADLRSRSRD